MCTQDPTTNVKHAAWHACGTLPKAGWGGGEGGERRWTAGGQQKLPILHPKHCIANTWAQYEERLSTLCTNNGCCHCTCCRHLWKRALSVRLLLLYIGGVKMWDAHHQSGSSKRVGVYTITAARGCVKFFSQVRGGPARIIFFSRSGLLQLVRVHAPSLAAFLRIRSTVASKIEKEKEKEKDCPVLLLIDGGISAGYPHHVCGSSRS